MHFYPQSTSNLIKIFLFGLFYLLAGMGVFVWGSSVVYHSYLSSSWPTVEGQIVQSTLRETNVDLPKKYPDIRYSYVIYGQVYESRQIRLAQHVNMSSNEATALVERYPVGRQVVVYYKPDDHTTVILEPGLSLSSFSLIFAGMCMFIVPSILSPSIYYNLKRRRI